MTVISCHVSPTPPHRPDTYLSPSHLFFSHSVYHKNISKFSTVQNRIAAFVAVGMG